MKTRLLYVELKTGHSDNGPAWIGRGAYSRSGRTVYFDGKAFQSCKGAGTGANYLDIETGAEYWISGVKRDGRDRHWAGSGKIMVDREALPDYLRATGAEHLPPSRYEIVSLAGNDARSRIHDRLNEPSAE